MIALLFGSLFLMAVGALLLIASVYVQRRSGFGDQLSKSIVLKLRYLGGGALLFGSFLPGIWLTVLVGPLPKKYNILVGSLALIVMGLLGTFLPQRTSRAAIAGWFCLAIGFLFLGEWFEIVPAGPAEWLATHVHQ
jgi:hypothetical protein